MIKLERLISLDQLTEQQESDLYQSVYYFEDPMEGMPKLKYYEKMHPSVNLNEIIKEDFIDSLSKKKVEEEIGCLEPKRKEINEYIHGLKSMPLFQLYDLWATEFPELSKRKSWLSKRSTLLKYIP